MESINEKKIEREYDKKWLLEKSGESGGQGCTFIVKNIDQTKNKNKYLLKLLKEQGNSERRKRMWNEVQALKKLNRKKDELDDSNKFFPKLIDDNCDKYKDKSVELYYVMEYVEGKELDKVICGQQHTLDQILESFMNLLKSVYICHENKIIHRDIKPANIMCRNGVLSEIVLIDFGMSYNEELETDDTKIGQEVENRFLHLPEKVSYNKDAKRNECSDITYCCGILFYMITRKIPKTLRDEKHFKPHERFENIMNLQWIGSENLKILNLIFDQAFEYEIDKRFRSIEDVVWNINNINLYPKQKYIYDDKIKSLCLTTILQSLKLADINTIDAKLIFERMRKFENRNISLGVCRLIKINEIFYLDPRDLWVNKATIDYRIVNDLNYMFSPNLNLDKQLQVIEDIELYAIMKFTNNNKIKLSNFYVNLLGQKQELLPLLDEDNKKVINNPSESVIKCEFLNKANLFLFLCQNGEMTIYDFRKSQIVCKQMICKSEYEIQKCIFSYTFDYMALMIDYTIKVYKINKENKKKNKFEQIDLPEKILSDNKNFIDIKFSNKNNILLIMTENNIYSYNIDTTKILNQKIKSLKIFPVKSGEIFAISNNDETFILKIENKNKIVNINTLEFDKNLYLPLDEGYINYNINDEIEIINSSSYIRDKECYKLYGYHNVKIGSSEEEIEILNAGRKYVYYKNKYDEVYLYDKICGKKVRLYKNNKKVSKDIIQIYNSKQENYIAILFKDSRIEIIKINQ